MSGIRVDDSGFVKGTEDLKKKVSRNTLSYGREISQSFQYTARKDAPWVDRKGVARRGLKGNAFAIGTRVRVEMGGRAHNYKAGAHSAKDYTEFLEFANQKKFAAIYPTADPLREKAIEDFGDAALKGKTKINIPRMKGRKR